MSTLITIDGSQGEGGGQILRSSLALSMLTGQPFRIEKIRAGRQKPGLLRQHLTAVNAAATVCSASVEGAAMGSRQLTFTPGAVKGGGYNFAIGSAGSTTLVLQTVLPALMVASEPSDLTLEGGTHNPHAPPLDFLEKAFLPLIAQMGPKVSIALDRPGFYPAGGGRFTVHIDPAPKLAPLHLVDRGEIHRRICTAILASLSEEIAQRELRLVQRMMDWPAECFQTKRFSDCGPGNLLMIEIASEHVCEVFTGFGMKGVTAEAVAEDALQQAKRYLAAGVPVGPYLADQLLLPIALAGGGSFVTMPLTRHSQTNIDIIQKFLPVAVTCEEIGHGRWKIAVEAGR